MNYRLNCNLDLSIKNSKEATKLFDKISEEVAKVKAQLAKSEDNSFSLTLHKCYHDQQNPRPCEVIKTAALEE